MNCQPDRCEYGFTDEEGTPVELPSGREIMMPGCPKRHMDEETGMWLGLYRWLATWKKTPTEMGLVTPETLDPRYFEAMELINAAMPKKGAK